VTEVAELASALGARLVGEGDAEVTAVHHDSRKVGDGSAFVAIPGANVDGAEFASGAVAAGAAAVIAERELSVEAPVLVVADARVALARAAHLVYGEPTTKLKVAGITGTNGKTTTAWLLRSALGGASLLGTVSATGAPAAFTTPEADDLARFVAAELETGAAHLVMEVSSHALALHRVDGVAFDVAAFTNLSQDHLDFHETMAAYQEAKARLFTELAPRAAVIDVDSEVGADFASRTSAELWSVGRREDARVRVNEVHFSAAGIEASLSIEGEAVTLRSPLVGAHNVQNLTVALGAALAMGKERAEVLEALATATGAPGRLERVPDPGGALVLVDYAHTPDALRNALAALRPLTSGRLIVVFGCGGDRDTEKRPMMGRAAGDGADFAVVTSDNPRTEDPEAIVDAIVPGVHDSGIGDFVVEVDREAAIDLAIRRAKPGDTVLIAGKGHEDYQIVGTTKRPFDDRAVARDAIRRRR